MLPGVYSCASPDKQHGTRQDRKDFEPWTEHPLHDQMTINTKQNKVFIIKVSFNAFEVKASGDKHIHLY